MWGHINRFDSITCHGFRLEKMVRGKDEVERYYVTVNMTDSWKGTGFILSFGTIP